MQFLVDDFKELKLLIESIDLERISAPIMDAEWWGTAGTIIVDAKKNLPGVLPVSNPGKPGSIISEGGGDNFIVTTTPKAFVWFAKIILFSKLPDPVACYEMLPFFHLAYCMSHLDNEGFDIKDELLYICDQLIERKKARERSMRPRLFFEEDDK